jgi:GT2 family glycosyltransferase
MTGSATNTTAATLPVAVVICTRNRQDMIGGIVSSILAGHAVPAQIIVIDQSDEPRVPEVANSSPQCEVRHVACPTPGVSLGRNKGAQLALQDLLVFTDDDLIAEPEWLESMVGALLKADVRDVVTGRVLAGPIEQPGGVRSAQVMREHAVAFEGRLQIDPLAGGNMAIRRRTYLDIGGFDERLGPGSRFPAAEDNDLGFRLLEAGGKIVYVPEAVLYHRSWRPASAYLPLRHAYGRGKGAYYAKHLRLTDRHMLKRMVGDVRTRAGRALRSASQPGMALAELAFLFGILRGSGEWFIRNGSTTPRKIQN